MIAGDPDSIFDWETFLTVRIGDSDNDAEQTSIHCLGISPKTQGDQSQSHRSSEALVMLHGAGSSAKTFEMLVKHLKEINSSLWLACIDLPGHGQSSRTFEASGSTFNRATKPSNVPCGDLNYSEKYTGASLASLSEESQMDSERDDLSGNEKDTKHINKPEFEQQNQFRIQHNTQSPSIKLSKKWLSNIIFETINKLLQSENGPNRRNDLFLIGHSLGGAIICEIADKFKLANLRGVALIDIVEGSAMSALRYMHGILQKRPSIFGSIEEAIDWHIHSGTLHTRESAVRSVPALLLQQTSSDGRSFYTWKTDLFQTEKHWNEWFTGLSEQFLRLRVAKLLMLTGSDRLDKAFLIAQMQGKFQLEIFPDCGHFIQEDAPEKAAETINNFAIRNGSLEIAAIRKIHPTTALSEKSNISKPSASHLCTDFQSHQCGIASFDTHRFSKHM